ncbi:MAG: IS1380 family transposase, partial [Microbacterium sp.]
FTANHAWLQLAVIAHNLSRAAATAAGLSKARMATLQRIIISTPARLASTGRRLVMHLPAHWP